MCQYRATKVALSFHGPHMLWRAGGYWTLRGGHVSPMTRALPGLGRNLGGKGGFLPAALEALGRGPRMELRGVSRVYETVPVEVGEEQPDYLNCVAEVECGVPVIELL